jgi:tetratricopeptide (TPR) repeat protein
MEKAILMDPKNAKFLRARSGLLAEMDRLSDALSDAEKAIRLEPENAFGFRMKGYVLMKMMEYNLASKNFLHAQELDSALTDDLLDYLGNCAYRIGNTEEAKTYFLKSIVADTLSGYAWYYLGLMATANGNLDSCLAMMDSSIHHDMKFTSAYTLKGETLMKQGKLELAILTLDSSIYLGGSEKDLALKLRGDAKRKFYQFDAAIMDYSKALLIDANYVGALVGRGKSYERKNDYERAYRDFKKVQEIDPNHLEAEYMLALLKWDQNQSESATAAFASYLESAPEDSRAWYYYGMLAEGRGDFESAIEHLTMSLATFSIDSGEVYYRRATCYRQLEMLKEANADMDLSLTLPTRYVPNLSGMGYELNVLHRPREAIKLLDSAIAMDSTHAYAFNNRGFAKYQLGQYESAILDFDRSIALKNNYFHLPPYNRANAKRALGRLQEAIADFDIALGYKPEYFEAFNDRGETWEKLNELDKARADYQAALKINPSYLPSRLGLERIGK